MFLLLFHFSQTYPNLSHDHTMLSSRTSADSYQTTLIAGPLLTDQAVQASCTLLHLFEALSDSAARSYGPGSTQTLDQQHARPDAGSGRHSLTLGAGSHDIMDTRMRQVEESHAARARSQQLHPTQGAEERMACFRQEVEEQARAEIIRQVCVCKRQANWLGWGFWGGQGGGGCWLGLAGAVAGWG